MLRAASLKLPASRRGSRGLSIAHPVDLEVGRRHAVMAMTVMYNEKVLEHFRNPRNVGKIDGAGGIGEHFSDVCGDHMCIYIAVTDNRIVGIKFLSLGCAASIASGSLLIEMVKGKTLEDAVEITKDDIVNAESKLKL